MAIQRVTININKLGTPGVTGKSQYEAYLETTTDNPPLSKEEWAKSKQGEKGDPFTFDDFTEDQLEDLKGERGDAFKFEDFTPAQIEALKVKGDAFVYADFTPSQIEALKVKGDKGDAFVYEDFTPAQLEDLKGETYNDTVIKNQVSKLDSKFEYQEKMIEDYVISGKYIFNTGNLNNLSAGRCYVYDIPIDFIGNSVNIIVSGNVSASRGYAFYNSETIFDSSTAILVRTGDYTEFDESVNIPIGSKKLIVFRYQLGAEPRVKITLNDERDVYEIINEQTGLANINPLSENKCVVKIDENGEVNVFSKISENKVVNIHFKKCMFNQLYTYYKVRYINISDINIEDYSYDESVLITTTGSDNIGPLYIKGGNWTGGNHSYKNDGLTKTAETLKVDIYVDNINIKEVGTFIGNSLQIVVKNMIYDPRVAPVGGSNILSTELCEEFVTYNVYKGDLSVTVSHRYLIASTVVLYYGMQTVTTLDQVITSGGNKSVFANRTTANSFSKESYPKFNRWVQRKSDKSIYESLYLNPDFGIGNHSLVTTNIANSAATKLYHMLINDKAVVPNEFLSWNGTYSWKLPIIETSDYIVFKYSANQTDIITINIFSSYNGFIDLKSEALKSFDIIDLSDGITVNNSVINSIGINVSASSSGFINLKLR